MKGEREEEEKEEEKGKETGSVGNNDTRPLISSGFCGGVGGEGRRGRRWRRRSWRSGERTCAQIYRDAPTRTSIERGEEEKRKQKKKRLSIGHTKTKQKTLQSNAFVLVPESLGRFPFFILLHQN